MTKRTAAILLALLLCLTKTASGEAWRSLLYPDNWTPGDADAEGRFLHDFSYAGYMRGSAELPDAYAGGARLTVTDAPYFADSTGRANAAPAIQRAIDDAGRAGGGTVFLPAGEYRLELEPGAKRALTLARDNVILQGEGPEKTRLYCATADMRKKCVILVGGASPSFDAPAGRAYALRRSVPDAPTNVLYLRSVVGLRAGQWIILRADRSAAFIRERGMEAFWSPSKADGPVMARRILSVDARRRAVTIDIPTRCAVKGRDRARVYPYEPAVTGVGIRDLSVGGRVTDAGSDDLGANDYRKPGTAAYAVHAACLIKFRCAADCWADNVFSYQPAGNAGGFHMPSNGLSLIDCRSVTVRNCDFSHPQYRGAGGNGYGFVIQSGECLLEKCASTAARHSFSFKTGAASGNVVYAFRSNRPLLPSDFHMHLSFANLIDSPVCARDSIEARVRPYGATPGQYHGLTATQTVIWNARGESGGEADTGRFLVRSQQYGWGYVIGTSGDPCAIRTKPVAERYDADAYGRDFGAVDTAPEDFAEGEGLGESLEPQSLYRDQLKRRLFDGGGKRSPPDP